MPTFAREVRTISLVLAGSQWALDPQMRVVLDEYNHIVGAGRLRNGPRRTSLQILFASRAIDSLLVHVVLWECNRRGGSPRPDGRMPYPTIGGSINFVQDYGVNGGRFSDPTRSALDNVTTQRNRFLHQAGEFPDAAELHGFLNNTLMGIQEIASWR
ncbi:MAG: hypothetical protein MN733_07945 [Nitrososphaera sp.]|nr:hypothetical protein [Nitrososphaera sp.]